MKPSTKAILAILGVALPAIFNFFAAKVASDEAKIRAEVAYVTMEEVVKELQEASYNQALQIAKLEGQAKCGALAPAASAPRVTPPKKIPIPVPPSVGAAPPVSKEPEILMSLPQETLQNEAPPPPSPPAMVVVYPDGGEEELPPPQSQKVRPPRNFEQAVKEFKAKK